MANATERVTVTSIALAHKRSADAIAAESKRNKTHGAYVTGKVVLAQLVPVLNVLLWFSGELLNGNGHPAYMCASQKKQPAEVTLTLHRCGFSSGRYMQILQHKPNSRQRLHALWCRGSGYESDMA